MNRRRQKKFNEVIQGISFFALLLSVSAMDSKDITIPAIALMVAVVVLLVSVRLEERRSNGQLR